MNKNELKLLDKLLYESTENEVINYINKTKNSKLLHFIVANYNWDDGFDIPVAVTKNKYCDLGTALMIFEYSEGYMMFFDDEWKEILGSNVKFISDLKSKIEIKDFQFRNITFIPSLTRVEKFKLIKNYPNINKIFIDGVEGEEIDIPII